MNTDGTVVANTPPGFPSLEALRAGILASDRIMLARAITLVESRLPAHRQTAEALLESLLPHVGKAHRLGVSGVPGVGKSTFIEALGLKLLEAGHRVMVLAIDPSSELSGGAILGDKTRMTRLAAAEGAFVRPTASAGRLGGVAAATRDVMLLGEAAGFDRIIVETVGTGQSETEVADMVDSFLLLLLPSAGDELQGIKKGVMERADIFVVNKADRHPQAAKTAARDIKAALRILRAGTRDGWMPPVLTVSALTGEGLAEVITALERHRAWLMESGEGEARRRAQRRRWLREAMAEALAELWDRDPQLAAARARLEEDVLAGRILPRRAARELVEGRLAAPPPTTRDE